MAGLIVLGLKLKIRLGMRAHRADLGRGLANMDVTAVAALPHPDVILLEHNASSMFFKSAR